MTRSARACLTGIAMMMAAVALPAQPQNNQSPFRLLPIVPDGRAHGINNRGQVVGEYATDQGLRAFLWWNGATIDLGVLPGGNFAAAHDINEPGSVVGFGNTGAGTEDRAILWRNGEVIDLGTLPGGDRSYAYAINNRGVIAGIATDQDFFFRPVLWVRGQPIDLGTPPGYGSGIVLDINERGQAVGYAFGELNRAVLWTDGAAIDLGTLPGDTESFATGINNRGQVVGVSRNIEAGTARAFIWEDGVMLELAAPPGMSAWADDISDGGLVAGTINPTLHPRAAVHDGDIFAPLGEAEASQALAINNRGDVVGASGAAAALWVRTHGRR